MFKKQILPDGIGEIMMALPREVEYADLVCEGLQAIFDVDMQYFSRQKSMTRQDLVTIPAEYALDKVDNPPLFLKTATTTANCHKAGAFADNQQKLKKRHDKIMKN